MDRNTAPFRQIAAALREQIESGALKPGDRVPSTRDLAQQWGVARGTIDRALAQLNSEGLVRITAGRAGTVVSSNGELADLILAVEGAHISEIAAAEVISLDADQATAIGVAAGTSLVKITVRLSPPGLDETS